MPKRTIKNRKSQKYKLDILPTWNAGEYINEADLIQNMSTHISNADPYIYEGYNLLSNKEKEEKAKVVHSSVAKKQREQGDYVLSFTIAGSGNAQWNKMYKGFNGINEVFNRALQQNNQPSDPDKEDAKEILNFLNEKYKTETNNDITENEEKLESALFQEYGKPMHVDADGNVVDKNKQGATLLAGFREQVKGTQTNINLAGPLGDALLFPSLAGTFNSGDYSIEKLENYVVKYADNWLAERNRELQQNGSIKPIHIHMKGHSRGGVAANESATLINKMIEDKYPALKQYVDFEVSLYDPVPGTGSYKEHASVDHTSPVINTPNGVGKGLNSDPIRKNSVTVLYSIHSNHNAAFTPQEVKGANRVILTGMNHNMGIYDIEDNHKASFIYAGNGEKYRGTGLSQLPEGTFFLDEKNVLVKAKSRTIAQHIVDSALSTVSKVGRFLQRARAKIMGNCINDFHVKHKDTGAYLRGNDANNKRIKEVDEAGRILSDMKLPNRRLIDAEVALRLSIASAIFYRVAENKSKTAGKELNPKQAEAQRLHMMDASKKIGIMMNDPSFKQYFSTLKYDDLKAFTEDHNGKKVDDMINEYRMFVGTPEKDSVKNLKARINKINAADDLSPEVYAVLINKGLDSSKILSPLALADEKAEAEAMVNMMLSTGSGQKELADLMIKAISADLKRMDDKVTALKMDPNNYFTDYNASTLAAAKMMGRMTRAVNMAANRKDSMLDMPSEDKEMLTKAETMSKAFGGMVNRVQSKLDALDLEALKDIKEIAEEQDVKQDVSIGI